MGGDLNRRFRAVLECPSPDSDDELDDGLSNNSTVVDQIVYDNVATSMGILQFSDQPAVGLVERYPEFDSG